MHASWCSGSFPASMDSPTAGGLDPEPEPPTVCLSWGHQRQICALGILLAAPCMRGKAGGVTMPGLQGARRACCRQRTARQAVCCPCRSLPASCGQLPGRAAAAVPHCLGHGCAVPALARRSHACCAAGKAWKQQQGVQPRACVALHSTPVRCCQVLAVVVIGTLQHPASSRPQKRPEQGCPPASASAAGCRRAYGPGLGAGGGRADRPGKLPGSCAAQAGGPQLAGPAGAGRGGAACLGCPGPARHLPGGWSSSHVASAERKCWLGLPGLPWACPTPPR